MKPSTHLRLANLIAEEVGLRLESNEAAYLRSGSIKPDEWRDFPHHHGVTHKIQRWILSSRKYRLKGDMNRHFHSLGIALHYIADRWTLLSGSEREHDTYEVKIDRCALRGLDEILGWMRPSLPPDLQQGYEQLILMLSGSPEGKLQTLAYAALSRPKIGRITYSTPELDFNIAYAISSLIARSVCSLTAPPEDLVKALSISAPWKSSEELLNRSPPKDLKNVYRHFLSQMRGYEKELRIARENLKRRHGDFLSDLSMKLRIRWSVLQIRWSTWRSKRTFNSQIQRYLARYKREVDWYYWGRLGVSTLGDARLLVQQAKDWETFRDGLTPNASHRQDSEPF